MCTEDKHHHLSSVTAPYESLNTHQLTPYGHMQRKNAANMTEEIGSRACISYAEVDRAPFWYPMSEHHVRYTFRSSHWVISRRQITRGMGCGELDLSELTSGDNQNADHSVNLISEKCCRSQCIVGYLVRDVSRHGCQV